MISDFEMTFLVMSVTITSLAFFYNAGYQYYYLQRHRSIAFVMVLSIQLAMALLVKYLSISNSIYYLLPFNVFYISIFYHILIKSSETKRTSEVLINTFLTVIICSYVLVLKFPSLITIYYVLYHVLLLIILLRSIIVYTALMTKDDTTNLTAKWYFLSLIVFTVSQITLFVYNLLSGFNIEELKITNILFLIFISVTLTIFIIRITIFQKGVRLDEFEIKKEEISIHEKIVQEIPKEKYQKSRLNDEELYEIRKKLNKIAEDQLYLDPELNLDVLSQKLKVSKYALSQTFSIVCSTNFNDYINYLRCEFALHFILEEKLSKSIIEIGYLSGFNSKTSFYRAFNKVYQCTPLEYRDKTLN